MAYRPTERTRAHAAAVRERIVRAAHDQLAERLVFRRAYADLFASALREGVDRGELRPLDAELVAAAIVGALAEALVGPLARRAEPDALVAGLQWFVLSAVSPQEP